MNRALLSMSFLLGALALACDKSSSGTPTVATTAATTTSTAVPSTLPATPSPSPVASTPVPATAGSAARIPSDKISAAGKSAADRVAKAYVDALKTGTFADQADLSEPLKKVTPAQWQQVFAQTKAKYGAEKSMEFADAWNDEKGGTMYRYRAAFVKADKVELRVDLDGRSVATKFGTYDWNESTP
jgi:hypothetical protein